MSWIISGHFYSWGILDTKDITGQIDQSSFYLADLRVVLASV